MRTYGDMLDNLTDDLMVAASSTLFDDARKRSLLKAAHRWATSLYSWPELQRGRDTTLPAVSGNGEQYFDYPQDFRTDTVTEFILVGGKKFRRVSWMSFLEHKLTNPTSDERVFADYGRQIFIYPHQTPSVEVCLWGQIQAPDIVVDSDTTIFSDHDETGNEAIVKRALSVGLRRIDKELATSELNEAVTLLSVIWKKVQDRQQYAQPLNKAMFNVPNYFPGNLGGTSARNFGTGGE